MILPFSTKFPNGEPTYFIEKIWASLFPIENIEIDVWLKKMQECSGRGFGFGKPTVQKFIGDVKPKRHTMRADKKNRWKAGNKIHPVINNRSKNYFQFAPVLECKSTQVIEIEYYDGNPIVVIDSKHYYNQLLGIDHGISLLASNDGFESVKDFFNWFSDDFEGKIIHWTDLKY